MPPKKRPAQKRTGVRGPNSALTEFLRNEGITDAFRQQRLARFAASPPDATDDGNNSPDPNIVVIRGTRSDNDSDGDEGMDDEEKEIRVAAARKRRAARSTRASSRNRLPDNSGSDASSSDSDFRASDAEVSDADGTARKFGQEDTCVECGELFNLTVYSRFVKAKRGYICESCNELLKLRERAMKRNELNARKKRKQVAQALLDKQTVRIPKLSDICVKVITNNISDVDALGDIGHLNMAKISRILSKNRSLNSKTIDLFLRPDLEELELWDCSSVDSDALNRIASYCPNLKSLTLFMCGQLHNENMQYYNTNLPHLSEFSLNGPFLISDPMWKIYLNERPCALTKFEVRNTHRFEDDALETLMKTSGKTLVSLKLSRLDGLKSLQAYKCIPQCLEPNKLTHLEMSFPHTPALIDDELLLAILKVVGGSLVSLNVDGCTQLTERFLVDGVSKYCPVLTHLSMRFVENVSDAGFASALTSYAAVNSGGLISVDLTKCTGLGDAAVYALFAHSGHTLVELSLNSIYRLSKDMLFQAFTDDHHPYKVLMKEKVEKQLAHNPASQNLAPPPAFDEEDGPGNSPDDNPGPADRFYPGIRLPLLTTFDFGFVRAVDNEILALMGKACPKLSVVEVFGDNRCNFGARVRDGLMIIGRQGEEA